MEPPAIEFGDVRFSYGGNLVLEDVSLSLPQKSFVSIVGPNGGGKTTLLKLALGLLRPDRGKIRVLGTSPRDAQRRIGYMPQHSAMDLQFPATVMDVVLMGRLGLAPRFGPFRRQDRQAAAEALREVGVEELRNRPIGALSGGQRQRVLIARALACDPDLLLLDEPTASLDVGVQDELYDLLDRLHEQRTVVIVSHDVGFVTRFVHTVICVNRAVQTHQTEAMTGDVIADMYGHEVRLVRHGHDCAEDHRR